MTNKTELETLAEPYRCCGCGKPWIDNAYKDCDCPTNCGFQRGTNGSISAKPRCARCNAIPIRANLDGDDLCQACCDKWVRGEGLAIQEEQAFREGYRLGFNAAKHPFHMPPVDDAWSAHTTDEGDKR